MIESLSKRNQDPHWTPLSFPIEHVILRTIYHHQLSTFMLQHLYLVGQSLNRVSTNSSHQTCNHLHLAGNPFSDSRIDLKAITRPNYAEHFNDIATQVGLATISSQDSHDSNIASHSPITPTSGKSTAKKTLFQRLSRKHSVSAIAGRDSPKSIKSSTLDDVCRLGGISVFGIPLSSATANLVIPTALAATGEYLVKHGIVRSRPNRYTVAHVS